jgi:FkbM family methyltransferase
MKLSDRGAKAGFAEHRMWKSSGMNRSYGWRTERGEYLREDQFPLRVKLLRWVGRQIWMPKGQDRLLRLIWSPASGGSFLFDVDFFGLRYRGDLAHYADWLVFCYGAAPRCELDLLAELAAEHRRRAPEKRLIFCDIGGNVGHHSLFMARLADQVAVFEPFSPLCDLIRDKITLNRQENITLYPSALGEADDEANYFPGGGENSGLGSLLSSIGSADVPVRVSVRNGDALCAQEGLSGISIIKIDVEGYEPQVLRGLARRMREDRPVVLTELSPGGRQGFGDEAGMRACFYPDARFAEVRGRHGRSFTLAPFDFDVSEEVLVVPPELADFIDRRLSER